MLGLVHALGAGSDASAVWFRWWVIVTTPVIGGLFVYRVLSERAKRQAQHSAKKANWESSSVALAPTTSS